MAGVVDDAGAVRARHLRDLFDVAALAVEMHVENRIRMARALQRVGQILRPHQAGIGIDIGKDHLGAGQMRRACGREERDRRHDDLRTGPEPQRARRHVQRRRAVGADDGVIGGDGFRELRLEAADIRSGGEEFAPHRFRDGGDIVLLDDLAAVGQEAIGNGRRIAPEGGRAHAKAAASSICRPRASRRSVLLSLE